MSIKNVRNFWIDCDIDGRESILSGGPRSKTDGMSVIIKQRNNGDVTTALTVSCFVNVDGDLETYVADAHGNEVTKVITKR